MAKRPTSRTKANKKVKFYHKWNKKFVYLIGVLLIASLGTLLLKAIFATTPVQSFSLYATHPYASQAGFDSTSVNYYTGQHLCATTFCPVGQQLIDMEVTPEGQLVAGYGDWDANVDSFGVAAGRVGIIPLDLNTNTWGSLTPAGSEALITIRKINGKIYAPTTDPSDTLGSNSGYVTNESGSWQLKLDGVRQEHLFDIATYNGTDRFEMGAIGDTSAVWRSQLNNGVWTREPHSVPGGYARYSWGAAVGGKFYIGGDSTYVDTAVFDGTTWQTLNYKICDFSTPKRVTLYEGKIVCYAGYGMVNVFDGIKVTTKSFPSTNAIAGDFYVDGTTLYMLDTSYGRVYRLTSLSSSWELIGQMPSGIIGSTLAIYNGYIYVGSNGGKIYRSDGIIGSGGTTTPPPPPPTSQMTVSGISPTTMVLDRTSQNLTITGSGFPAGVAVKVGSSSVAVVSRTDTQVVVAVDTAVVLRKERIRTTTTKSLPVTLSASGMTSVSAPSLTVTYTK